MRSRDRLVAVSIVADRTADALAPPVEEFATSALGAVPGFEGQLEPGTPQRFRHRYEAVGVKARGSAERGGVDQRLELIVLRRADLATVTILIAANQRREAASSQALAEELVRTVRTRPVRFPAGG